MMTLADARRLFLVTYTRETEVVVEATDKADAARQVATDKVKVANVVELVKS